MNTLDTLIEKWENNELCMDDRLAQVFIDSLIKYLVSYKKNTDELFRWSDNSNIEIIHFNSLYEVKDKGVTITCEYSLLEVLENAKYVCDVYEALNN